MKILLRKVSILDKSSPFHHSVKDILIENSIIKTISDNIHDTDAKEISDKNLCASSGWVDIFTSIGDPGYEFKETIQSATAAAAQGGYTTIFCLPNTQPAIQSKSQVEYILSKGKNTPVSVLPLGCITRNVEGKDLAEMYDMHHAGAVAFSDGINPVQTSGLLLKALQYVKAFDGTIIQMPIDKSIGTYGLMNEGVVSTQMGLPGIPSIGEELIIKRDIDLVRYTNSKLHITGISTAKAVELVAAAKEEGLQVSCSVTPYHLYFNEEDIVSYNTNLKVNPPLRSKKDMMALREAVMKGTIDCIASHHFPQDTDNKICEFENAKYGMLGLQTAFNIVNEILPDISQERIAEIFSFNARDIFKLPATIKEDEIANITLFTKEGTSTLTKENNQSKSANTAFFNISLKGRVIGIIAGHQSYLNI